MFLVRYFDPTEGYVVVSLVPRPTEVDYPEKRLIKVRPNRDGGVVIQRPMRDARPRRWIWKNYRPHVPNYEDQWQLLSSLDTQALWNSGLADNTVQIWENDNGEGGFDATTDGEDADTTSYTNLKWTQVKITQVARTSRKGGGPTTYDDSVVEFVIVDPEYSNY